MAKGPKRSRSAIAALAVLLGTLTNLACNTPSSAPPPAIRLADERHRGEQTGPAHDVPTAVVGGVRRPVIAPGRPALLKRSIVAAAPGSTVSITAPIEDRLRSAPIRLDANVNFLGAMVPEDARAPIAKGGRLLGDAPDARATIEPSDLPSARTEETFTVEIPSAGEKAGDTLVEISARPAEASWTSPAVSIPDRARLRFAVAIDPMDRAGDGAPPATARIEVLDGKDAKELFRVELDARTPPEQRRWEEHEVDLSDFAGKNVSLRFTGTKDGAVADAIGDAPLVLWADPVIQGHAARPSSRATPSSPNLILISLDTLRPDHLDAYGHTRPTSPAIDARIAARGTLFEHAYTPFPHTAGSHMTMLTSVDPCVHGLDSTAWSGARRLRDGVVTLAEVLRAAGYDTGAFTENAWVTAALGYDRGFATFVEDSGTALDEGNIETTFARAFEWIEQERGAPFFAFVHTYQVHEPYTPPAGYPDKVGGPLGQDRGAVEKALYDAEIRYTDDVVARFLMALDEQHLSEDTLLVVTADHGQHFGEHFLFGHGNSLHDALLHVPLLLRGPGVPAGKRVSDSVGLIDLMPTVLELLGIPRPPNLQGLSLTGTLRGEKVPERILFAELLERGFLAARKGGLKILLDLKVEQASAYAYRLDPGEQIDLGKEVTGDEWFAILRAHRQHCDALASLPSAAPRSAPIDAKVRSKLEALGYTE